MKTYTRKLLGGVLISLLHLAFSNNLFAQACSQGFAYVGELSYFDIYSATGATNIVWTVDWPGVFQEKRDGDRFVSIKWMAAGAGGIVVTYNQNGTAVRLCWDMRVSELPKGGTIASQVPSIVYNDIFFYSKVINVTPASGGQGVLKYQWEESADEVTWSEINSAIAADCSGSNIFTQKKFFRRKVSDDNNVTAYSNTVAIDVTTLLQAGRIASSQTITPAATPGQLNTVAAPSGGTGTYTYQWESSVDEISWSSINGATAAVYQPAALSQTTYYRRKVSSESQTAYTNTIQVLIRNGATLNKPATNPPNANAPKETLPGYTGLNVDNLNSVTSYAILKPGITDVSQISALTQLKDFQRNIIYLDGLGRPMQSIDYKSSPTGKDIAAVNVYDQYGRETVQHMAYVAPTDAANAGKFRSDAAAQQPQFLNSLTGNQEDYFYTINKPEESPVSRVAMSAIPGKSYAGKSVGSRTAVRLNYDYDNVRIWTIGNNASDVPYSTGVYGEGSLSVSVITDAHGSRVYEFMDKEGNVVMKSVQLDADKDGEGLRTYFVYDEMRNLRYVLPPLAVKYCTTGSIWNFVSSTTAQNVLKELGYKFLYDEKGRVIVQEIPGMTGPTYMVYDVRDRLVFTQQTGLRGQGLGEWVMYLYDGLDRLVMTALYKNTTATRESLQALLNQDRGTSNIGFANPPIADLYVDESTSLSTKYEATNSVTFLPGFESPVEMTVEINPNAAGISETVTVNNPVPNITGYEPVMVLYYDNYDWIGAKRFSTSFTVNAGNNPYAESVSASVNLSGKVTGTKVKVLGKNQWLSNTIFYDDKGRVIQNQNENISGGNDVVTTQYDFSGKILSTYLAHKNPRSSANSEVRTQMRYEYDDGGRILQTYHTLYNGTTAQTKLLSESTYDELGRTKNRKLGTLESLIYDYNLQGQLKGVNAEYARNKTTAHYFGMELFYDQGFLEPRMDGTVSGTTWRRKGNPDEAHAFGYGFDNAGRLIKADYTQSTSGTWANDLADYKVSIPAYDENGNIKRLKQDGMLLGNVKSPMDDLTYFNQNNEWSNRLRGVTDQQGDKKLGDFKNYVGRTGVDDYIYDANGNLTKDKNRGITITYNYLLNKPEKISIDSDPNKYIVYVYDATGEKLQKIVKDGSNTTTYTYINGFVYKNDVLQVFPHPEGRIRRNANGMLVYDYFIEDNLGNIRTVITEETNQVYYKASHEDNPQPAPVIPEREVFSFPKNVDIIPANHKFYDYNGTNRKFIKLNSNDPDRKIGTAKVLRVMAGDQLEIGAMSYYPVNTADNNTPNQPVDLIIGQLINLLLGPYTVIPNGKNNILQSNSNGILLNKEDFSAYISNTQTGNPPSTVPKAYLNYTLFDDNFKMVSGGVARVSQPDVITPLTASLSVIKNGYLYLYVSNESPTDVYFDDVVVKHTTGHLLQEDSYYPFGLQIRALSSMALNRLQNDYLYNGIEKISEFDLEVYDALYRNLDPQVGRWWQIDPVAAKYAAISPYNSNFNNPTGFSDPLGDDPPWWLRLLSQKRKIGDKGMRLYDLNEVVIRPERLSSTEIIRQIVTDDFIAIAINVASATQRHDRPVKDNLRQPIDLKPVPIQKLPAAEPQVESPITKFGEVKPADPCYICPELARQEAFEKEITRRKFETQQGASFMIVSGALDAAASEYATMKVAQGLGRLGRFAKQGSRGVRFGARATHVFYNPGTPILPIRDLSWKGVRVTERGIAALEKHLSRFGSDQLNAAMVERLKAISKGTLEATDYDLRFYTHELREYVRFRKAGYAFGEYPSELYYIEHEATVVDYGIQYGPQTKYELYHPDLYHHPDF